MPSVYVTRLCHGRPIYIQKTFDWKVGPYPNNNDNDMMGLFLSGHTLRMYIMLPGNPRVWQESLNDPTHIYSSDAVGDDRSTSDDHKKSVFLQILQILQILKRWAESVEIKRQI